MNQLKKLSELEGKTITSAKMINLNDEFVLFFDDGYFVVSFSEINCDIELVIDNDLIERDKLTLGIISQSDYDEYVERMKKLTAQRKEIREREQLALLTKRYGVKE